MAKNLMPLLLGYTYQVSEHCGFGPQSSQVQVMNTFLFQIVEQGAKEIYFHPGGNNKIKVVTDISTTDDRSRSIPD